MAERPKFHSGRGEGSSTRTHTSLMPLHSEDEGYTDDSRTRFVRHGSATSITSGGSSSRHSLDYTMSDNDRSWAQESSRHLKSASVTGNYLPNESRGQNTLAPPTYDLYDAPPRKQYGHLLSRPRSYFHSRPSIRRVGPTVSSWLRRARRSLPRGNVHRAARAICGPWCQLGPQSIYSTRPATILVTVVVISLFLASVTKTIIYILDTDKEPMPWRSHCAAQGPFPHAKADSLDPVNVFMGIFSVDSGYERRNLIRSTWLKHTAVDNRAQFASLVGTDGLQLHHNAAQTVSAKFIIGRPRKNHARRIALEMELYNDIVVLDLKENMNLGKSYHFFQWAAENATVPIWKRKAAGSQADPVTGNYELEMVRPDYVSKADDDSFIMLDELERHLRVAERERLYWGYYVREGYMAGELYVLSRDLVEYVATYPPLRSYTRGAEDQRTAKWMRMYPYGTVNWRTEQCRIYDHPKAGTSYSHGFLFEDEIITIQKEASGLSDEAKQLRKDLPYPDSYTTAGVFRRVYKPPMPGMTIAEEVEALVEGGGRFNQIWYDLASIPDEDVSLSPNVTSTSAVQANVAGSLSTVSSVLTPVGGSRAPQKSLPDSALQRQLKLRNNTMAQRPKHYMTTKYTDPWADPKLGRRRRGGTIAVHYIKRHEWFLETASALLGRQAWTVPAREYRPVLHRTLDQSAAPMPAAVLTDDPITGGSPWVDDTGSSMVWPERMRPPLHILDARRLRLENDQDGRSGADGNSNGNSHGVRLADQVRAAGILSAAPNRLLLYKSAPPHLTAKSSHRSIKSQKQQQPWQEQISPHVSEDILFNFQSPV